MAAKYQVYKDVAGKFRFRLKAENNRIVAVSQAYQQHEGCMNVQDNCNAEIERHDYRRQQNTQPQIPSFL